MLCDLSSLTMRSLIEAASWTSSIGDMKTPATPCEMYSLASDIAYVPCDAGL